MKRIEQIAAREIQKEQLQSRKAAREVLQYTSSQALTKATDKEFVYQLTTCSNPAVTAEFTMQQSLQYRNPSTINTTMSPSCVYSYKNCTTKQLKGLLRPTVLRGDRGIVLC